MSSSAANPKKTVIRADAPWWKIDFKHLLEFRDFAWILSLRDIQIRYKQTVMGSLWAILNPFLTMVVLSVFFGQLLGVADRVNEASGSDVPYPIFLYAGLLPWNFFAQSANLASMSLVSNAAILRKIYVPKLMLPFGVLGAPALDFLVATILLVGMMIFYSVSMNVTFLLIPFLLITMLIVVLGVGLLLSALTVAFRDFRYVIPFGIQLWFYLTPVIYPTDILPESLQFLYQLNPMVGIVECFRAIVLGSALPYGQWLTSILVGIVVFTIGLLYFSKVERTFADIA